ncbi:MAG: serine/threonine protein kinase [Candidatus Hydrogenedentes bacterium]|nr:serine/threonine protein kinase [Candidatus Hydrogenedentota bacterium]
MSVVVCPRCTLPNVPSNGICPQCGALLSEGLISMSVETPIDPEEGDVFQVGDSISDRYIVQALIGRGGMGSVYKVLDKVLEEELALKILLPHFATDKQVVERFINEVRITRKITHPNIVRVHDIGLAGDNLFISMEYVDGESLRTILERMGPSARLTVRQSVYILTQLCIALKYAHRYTVHRDIKPDNILVTRRNHIKLMDFGISKLMDERFDTNANAVVGTPRYMAPEQIHHAPDVDGRADIYSMGVVLHELITGKLPAGLPKPVSYAYDDVPPELDAILLRCLEPDREKRFANTGELREALRSLSESSHDSENSVTKSSQSSSSDIKTPSPIPATMTDVFESFMKEENIRTGASESAVRQQFVPGHTSAVGSHHDASSEGASNKASPLTPNHDLELPTRSTYLPKQHYPGFWERHSKIMVVLLILLFVFGFIFVGKQQFTGEGEQTDASQYLPDREIIQKQVDERLAVKGSFTEAFDSIHQDYEREPTLENKEALDIIREMLIEDIRARIYAIPFDMKKMNSASNDVVRASQIDDDYRILTLVEEVNKEVAQFKFVLTGINAEQGNAVFRINNPYYPEATETAAVGDFLQKRFLVSSIGSKSVFLEDTSPRCKGRNLFARLMEPLAAE